MVNIQIFVNMYQFNLFSTQRIFDYIHMQHLCMLLRLTSFPASVNIVNIICTVLSAICSDLRQSDIEH